MSEAALYGTSRRVVRRRTHALREGITVGLIGAAIMMVWFFIVDLAAGVPLRIEVPEDVAEEPARLGQLACPI